MLASRLNQEQPGAGDWVQDYPSESYWGLGRHAIAAWLLLSIYGTQVCPFLDSLSITQVMIPMGLMLVGGMVARGWLRRYWVLSVGAPLQVRRTLQLDLMLFILMGTLLALFNTLVFSFPAGSGLKVVLGFSAIGFFAALELALGHEYRLAQLFQQRGLSLKFEEGYVPLAAKFSAFAMVSILLMTVTLFLVINKDLEWLVQLDNGYDLSLAQRSILIEFTFVALVILAYMVLVILAYARNLRLFLEHEHQVLIQVTQGDLDSQVMVSTTDEFGLIGQRTNQMIMALKQTNQMLIKTQAATIFSLGALAETRDPETGAHLLRTQRYVRLLAEQMATLPGYADQLDPHTIELLFQSAPLHDIGKVGIPDHILLKPGKLDEHEFNIMKGHAMLGAKAIQVAERQLGENSFLRYAHEIAANHHEKWDGSGYPRGLKGEAIPLSGRLMAVADVYDALISKRVYKEPFSHEKAMGIILSGAGGHFDPQVIEVLRLVEPGFIEIATRYQDGTKG